MRVCVHTHPYLYIRVCVFCFHNTCTEADGFCLLKDRTQNLQRTAWALTSTSATTEVGGTAGWIGKGPVMMPGVPGRVGAGVCRGVGTGVTTGVGEGVGFGEGLGVGG